MRTTFFSFEIEDNPLNLSLRVLNLHHELHEKYGECLNEFTTRELEVIDLIAQGLNSQEIGDSLFISKHTVDTHRKNIYRKGNFKSIRDVILFSLVFGH